MKIHTYPDYDTMSKAVADLVAGVVKEKPGALVCFPSGDSPTGMLRYLVDYSQDGKIDFGQTNFVALDEWVGMDKNDTGSCSYYLNKHFFEPLNIAPGKVRFFDAKAADLDAECEKINEHIKQHGRLDIMIVGIGMNGHIGLNEPGTDFNVYAHHSGLDMVTVNVAQKYFEQQTALTGGITLGLRHLAEAGLPVLIATGSKKAGIIAKALKEEISNKVPASIFQTLAAGQVYLDTDAAKNLN